MCPKADLEACAVLLLCFLQGNVDHLPGAGQHAPLFFSRSIVFPSQMDSWLLLLLLQVYPVSDVWAAGVMTYQLLSSRLPFDDWKNTRNPALSQLWCAWGQEQLKPFPLFYSQATSALSRPGAVQHGSLG